MDEPVRRWVIDGMNVVGARPDGWWRDRRAAIGRLVAELERFARNRGEPVSLFLDGRPFPLEHGELDVHFAPGGRNAADRAIVAWLEQRDGGRGIVVVTSDAALAEQVRALGAETQGAGAFRRRLEPG